MSNKFLKDGYVLLICTNAFYLSTYRGTEMLPVSSLLIWKSIQWITLNICIVQAMDFHLEAPALSLKHLDEQSRGNQTYPLLIASSIVTGFCGPQHTGAAQSTLWRAQNSTDGDSMSLWPWNHCSEWLRHHRSFKVCYLCYLIKKHKPKENNKIPLF